MRLQTADLNADNKLDVVVVNVDRNTITVFRGDGAGGLSAGTNFDAGPRPLDPTIADFDGNGTLDVAVPNNGSSTISLFSGNGAGGLNPPVAYPASAVPNGLAKGDFNQDNKPDLAVMSGTAFGISILKNVTAALPCFSVNDVTVTEGDSGSVNLNFVVTLSAASSQTVRVNYSLAWETATRGADFTNLSDRLALLQEKLPRRSRFRSWEMCLMRRTKHSSCKASWLLTTLRSRLSDFSFATRYRSSLTEFLQHLSAVSILRIQLQ